MSIVLLSLSLILFISLFSFDPNDPGFNTTGNKEINNFIGLMGAYFSSTSFVFFGVASYFIPLLFISLALSVIQGKETKASKEILVVKLVAFILILVSTCSVSSIHFLIEWMPEGSGGILGLMIASSFIQFLDVIGTTLLMLALWFSFLPLFLSLISFLTSGSRLEADATTELSSGAIICA